MDACRERRSPELHARPGVERIEVVGYRRIPDELAGSRVDGQQVRIERAEEQPIAERRQASIRTPAPARCARCGCWCVLEGPEDFTANRVERHDIVGRLYGVEDSVDDEGCRLEPPSRLRCPQPSQVKLRDVLGSKCL